MGLSSIKWGENSRRLFSGLASIGPFFVLARALTAGGQILAGRWLGPAEYGLAALVVASSAVLLVPLQLGFALAVVKFAAMEKDFEGQAELISTAFWLNLAWQCAAMGGLYLVRAPLSLVLHLPMEIYLWSLAYSILLAFYTLIAGALQGVLRFKQRGRVELVYGLGAFFLFILFYRLMTHTFAGFIASLMGALALSCLAAFYYVRNWIKPVLTRKAFNSIASYTAAPTVISAAMVLIQSTAPLILGADLSAREVGFFGAYELGSIGIAMVAVQIIGSVLTPLASRPERQRGAWEKYFSLCGPLFILAFVVFFGSDVVMLKMVGKNYPINWEWVCLFSAAAAFCFLFFTASALLNARDVRGVWEATGGLVVTGLVNLVASFWAIARFGFAGAAAAALVSYAAGFLWCSFCGRRDLRR